MYSLTSNWQDADDITQEALLKAFRGFSTFDQRSTLSTWLYTVARSASIDWHRSRLGKASQNEKSIGESLPAPGSAQDDTAAGKQDSARLWAAIHELDERGRTPLVLFEIEGLSYDEIAAIEQVPVGTIRSRLNRARQRLRELLSEADVTDSTRLDEAANDSLSARRSHA